MATSAERRKDLLPCYLEFDGLVEISYNEKLSLLYFKEGNNRCATDRNHHRKRVLAKQQRFMMQKSVAVESNG